VPFRKDQIRYFLSETIDAEELMIDFLGELNLLCDTTASNLATTLLIHPKILTDFEDYLDFASEAEAVIEQAGLDGVFQIATFHPDYRFADAPADDPAHYTNRSPFPMLHIIREESISEAAEHYPDLESIPRRNMELLREMGRDEIRDLLAGIGSNKKD
ncbi:MAG: DUF1415 domain-containing protein, partial [Lewinella sp.]|nr:DUF1415 domain-containing protein [Lewinella sp.]